MTPLLAPTFISHLHLRLLETPLDTNSGYATELLEGLTKMLLRYETTQTRPVHDSLHFFRVSVAFLSLPVPFRSLLGARSTIYLDRKNQQYPDHLLGTFQRGLYVQLWLDIFKTETVTYIVDKQNFIQVPRYILTGTSHIIFLKKGTWNDHPPRLKS